MHHDSSLLLTAVDLLAWLALGGLPMCAAALVHRWCAPLFLPLPVVRLMAVGLVALAARQLSAVVGPLSQPQTLEQFAGGGLVGDVLMALGLLGLTCAAKNAFGPRVGGAARRKNLFRLCAALVPVCAGLPYAMMPPWAPDESIYHLSLQLHSILSGHTWAPVGHGNGGFFSLGEHYLGAALWMGSVSAGRGAQIWLVIFATDALWALWPRLWFSQVLLAQVLFVCSPIAVWQLGCAYVDISQAAFALVAAASMARFAWRPNQRAHAAAAAWLLGCAVACKYSALPYVMLFAGVLVCGARQKLGQAKPCGRLVPAPLFFALCLVAFFAPFAADVAHNLMRYHTPLYPFGTPWWPGAEVLGAGQRAALSAFLGLHGPTWDAEPVHGLPRYLMLPYAVLFAADFASVRFDGVVGQVPVLLALLALLHGLGSVMGVRPGTRAACAFGRVSRLRWALGLYACMGVLIWMCTSLQARFLMGPLWAMAWLVALSWPPVASGLFGGRRRYGVAAGLVCGVAMGTALLSLAGHLPPLSLSVLGQDRAGRHRARLRAVPASALCDAVPASSQGKTMLVWSQRLSLFCLGDQVSDSYDEAATLKRVLTAAGRDTPRAIAMLREQNIGHLLVQQTATREDLGPDLWARFERLAQALGPARAGHGPYRLYKVTGSGP